ncbi:MAG: class I adenylate-forming enzyme family protein [Candidatus Binatia bacterium]
MARDSYQVGFFAGEALERSARNDPGKIALIAKDGEMSFAMVNEAVTRLAAHMQSEGVKQGDRVGLLLPNSLGFPLCYYATQKMGAVTTVMDARLRGKELERILQDGDLSLLITHRNLMPEIAQRLAAFEQLPLWVVDGEGDVSLQKRLSSSPPAEFALPRLDPEQDALILYTSGTTGEPKGVVLSYINLAQYPRVMAAMGMTSSTAVWGCILPMSHIVGPVLCNDTAAKGCTTVIFDQINPISLLEGIERHRVTIFPGVPAIFQLLLGVRNLRDYDTRSVQVAAMMGTTVPVSLMHAFKAAQPHIKVIQGYGLTETSPMITLVELERADAKFGSIGRSVPGVEVRIVNEEGEDASEGEIITRGPHVMKGYFRKPQATAERIRDGWLYTGDVGRQDTDGYYYHLGRKDDMIITGGLNVYPAEVEDVLCQHPGVLEAVVFPIPDPDRGNIIRATVVPRPGEEVREKDLLSFLRSNLASFKVPQRIEVRESLPHTATGKIKRETLG